MARKKRVDEVKGNAPWLNTFADLMNLLLCFFVMLFAFSDINKEKFEKVSISIANSIGVRDAGSSTNNEALISSGMKQLSGLDEYFTIIEKAGEEATHSQGADSKVGIQEALTKVQEEMANANQGMFDTVSDLTDQYHLKDYVELSIAPDNKYVQLTLKGAILFASGDAQLKASAKPILLKISYILQKFEGCNVEITGHTDNVPIRNTDYMDNNWLSSARALNAAEYLIDECNIDPAILKYSGRGEYEPISSNATPQGRAKNRRIEIKIYNEYSSGQ